MSEQISQATINSVNLNKKLYIEPLVLTPAQNQSLKDPYQDYQSQD